MSDESSFSPAELAEHLARLDQRMDRIEQQLGLVGEESQTDVSAPSEAPEPMLEDQPEEDFEMVVGQSWFARVGVFVLICGVGLTMGLPFAALPPALPSIIGIVLALGLFLVGHFGRSAFQIMAGYCRGAGMALSFVAVLRLFFFGATPALGLESNLGRVLLIVVVGMNLILALRERSVMFLTLALIAGFLTAALVGSPWFVYLLIIGLIVFTLRAATLRSWPNLVLVASVGAFTTHLFWTLGRPWSDRAFHIESGPSISLGVVLVYIVLLALGPLFRRDRSLEDPGTVLVTFLSCSMGYGLLLMHTMAAFPLILAPVHVVAALVFMGLAAAHWNRESSQVSTFLYAMTGYLALSVVILKSYPVPTVFLWLSMQSLIVVATALWFRSRFIVVANFVIYWLIVAGCMIVSREEGWINLGFGVVALVTARILNWQRTRLELRTDIMRNAYLGSAFLVFPYALYQLVPQTYVSLSWVGIAVVYYLLNLVVKNPKYRWMGHLTLLATVGYVLLIGVTQLAPTYRIITFLVLGAVLLVVSLLFTRSRSRRQNDKSVKKLTDTPLDQETDSSG